jgi:heme exporter protein C
VILRLLLFAWVAAALLGGFLWAPLVGDLGETTRVLYFHIPSAWITVLALGWSTLHSIQYLRTRRPGHDDQAAAAAELGVLFCIAAAVSGSLWARARWGSYWNWDPRETTIFFLFLIYAAYLALRSAIEGEEKRARLAAVYSVVAFVTVPFLVFVVPRLYATLHPSPILPQQGEGRAMDPRLRLCFLAMLAGFTALFFWILSLRVRLAGCERREWSESAARTRDA